MTGEARHPEGESGPLSRLTVLDCSRALAGPFCAMQLGDLGADVVKVERPGEGDQTRAWAPPTYGDSGESAYYLSVNRNKRSIALNLATEAGRDVLRTMAAEADVLVENFRVGKADEWGVGYEALREVNEDLVYCAITGYGEWGPDRDRPAYDVVMQAEGGLMSVTGEAGGPPVRVGVAVADVGAGMYATQAVLAALLSRELGGGGGQKVDVSLLDGQVAWLSYVASFYFATGDPPGRMGSKHPTISPYQAFETADGHAVVAVASPNLWANFCAAIDREDLRDDDRFATNADRVANREELDRILEREVRAYDTEAFVALLREHDVPASAVNDVADVFDHPQVRARGMRAAVSHPTAGEVEMPASPMHLSRTPTSIRRHPPLLGEHTDELLAEFGYDEAGRAALRDADAV